ncbi:type II toxin-antitoxin system RnlA family toxin [Lactococcus lactis]|uniref:type II toxin-antitoxin system RnlA family toxin n=1 Tax=Lactococcus lactis TaxID=1358 RepID=UPI00240EEDC5|nr:type II toxin-antitoxin system RnlA family toxin [Lactococcus lactis]
MAGKYRGLAINRKEIKDCMENYLNDIFPEVDVDDEKHVSNELYRYIVLPLMGKSMFLDFYFNNNGTTTIQVSSGGSNDIKINLAEYIIKKELSGVISTKSSVSIKNIKLTDFEVFLSLLNENKNIESIDIEALSDGLKHSFYNIKGTQGDSIKITYYQNGTILMQGKPLLLFSELTWYIIRIILESY